MEIEKQIKQKLESACQPELMDLLNESHMHAGPATESHFKLTLVSGQFSGLNAVKRHQYIYRILSDELSGPVHALAMHLFTPEEWAAQQDVPDSPLCAGKNLN